MEERTHEGVEDAAVIKNGLIRIAVGGVVGIALSQAFEASTLAYVGVFLSLAFGIVLILGRPAFAADGLVGVVIDAVAATLIVLGAGERTPFVALFFLIVLGVVWTQRPQKAGVGAFICVAGYFLTFVLGGGAFGATGVTALVLFAVFCAAAWVLATDVEALREKKYSAEEALEEELAYSQKIPALASGFAPVLGVLDQREVLGWISVAARRMTGAAYAHTVLLDGNQHSTSAKDDLEVYPTWWHPSVQEMVLRGSRSGGALRNEEREVHGIKGFIAVPVRVEGSDHDGTLLAGGKHFDSGDERALEMLAGQASPILEGTLEAPGGRDLSTGLPNRASLFKIVEGELARGGAETLISVCLDAPRNGGPGSADGESLLAGLAKELAGRQRVFRYGPDELFILIRGNNRKRAQRVSAWASEVAAGLPGGSARVKVGYAVALPEDESPDRAILQARRGAPEEEPKAPQSVEGLLKGASPAVAALLEAVAIKDAALEAHLRSVCQLAQTTGSELGLEKGELRILALGALLHDVGKIGVPDKILKKPDRLEDTEFEVIKRHTLMGAEVLSKLPELRDVVEVVRHHHERFDGAGYPDGLRKEEIPLASRIILVADAYDSMVQDRPYRKGLTPSEALREIEENAGSQFDPDVARAFLRVMRLRKWRTAAG